MTVKVERQIEAFSVDIGNFGIPGDLFIVPPGEYEAQFRNEELNIIEINISGKKVWRSENGWTANGAEIVN